MKELTTKKLKLPTAKQIEKLRTKIVAARLSGKSQESVDIYPTLLELYSRGVRYVVADFSGYGDSGDVNSICCYNTKDKDCFQDYMGEESKLAQGKLCNFIYEIVENNVTCDWVNNDGGGGNVTIELPSLKLHLTSYWNETVSHPEDDTEINLDPLNGGDM